MVPDPLPLHELRRALVIKLRHHGDVLLASPVLSVLKNRAPQIEVDALVYADTAEMLSLHPALAQLFVIDRQWKRLGLVAQISREAALLRDLRARRYDLVIHLTEHWRGAWITRLSDARWSVAAEVRGRGKFWRRSFTHLVRQPRAGGRHVVETNLDALRRLGLYPQMDERRLVMVPGIEAELEVDALLGPLKLSSKGFVHVHPASRWQFKCWPAEKMAELIGRLQADGWPVLLTAGPDSGELAMIEAIQARLTQPALSLAGRLSLKQLAALTARARLFVGVDSAPMHIAAAMQTPVVALFGPSGDNLWGPWTARQRVIANNDYGCRPCGIDGCGGSKVSDCLVTLPVESVLAACRDLLAA
ncbi:MAG TPA: putative lipopolysaccharide heptosyltransferase III [Rhodocyclaceae bacterium]|nr:putative lipopolysaccharide heptosyltransferase III [Rhodocyclaceae bacterium]